MRKYLLAGLMAGAAAISATPASAQEATPFSGVRVEGIVGYDTTDVEDENSSGIAYGAGVGYDFQMGGLVAGIEAEASDSTLDECVSDVDLVGDELCVQAGRDLYVGGRIGAAVSRNVLLYGKAGYTNARVALDYEDGTAGTCSTSRKARIWTASASAAASSSRSARTASPRPNIAIRTTSRASTATRSSPASASASDARSEVIPAQAWIENRGRSGDAPAPFFLVVIHWRALPGPL